MASIYKQGKVYWIQFYRNGKRFQESLRTKDRKEAKFLLAKKESEIFQSRIPDGQLDAFIALERYNDAGRYEKAPKTLYDDNIRIRKFLEFIKAKKLTDISESSLKDYLHYRFGNKEIGLNSANHIITNIKTFLKWCVRQNIIAYNPIADFKKYKLEKAPKRFLTKKEIEAILDASKDERLYPMIAAAIYGGMRLGELKRLEKKDIDFEKGIIMIHKSKSKKFRFIPLHDKLRPILQEQKEGLLFDTTNIRRLFARITKRAKVGGIGFHTLRHTFASHLVQAGVSIYKVSSYLGHSTTTTTEIYAHLQPSFDNEINKL